MRYTCNGRHAAGDSINQIATLGARQGDQLTVATGGPEAEAVLRVEALAAGQFWRHRRRAAGSRGWRDRR
ncbi:MAG: HPr family phosphocarrier protein [Caldilineaceae bacterium]